MITTKGAQGKRVGSIETARRRVKADERER